MTFVAAFRLKNKKKHHGDMLKRKSKKKRIRIVKYSITYMKVDGRVRKKYNEFRVLTSLTQFNFFFRIKYN